MWIIAVKEAFPDEATGWKLGPKCNVPLPNLPVSSNRTWPTPPLSYDAEAHKPRRTPTGAQSPSPDDTVVEVAFPSNNDMHLSCNTDICSNILVRTKDYSRKQSILEGLHRNKIPSWLLLFMLTRHQPIDGR
ncbi:hypothetical protein MHU86_13673 [Fragilaria crotonensis]|nr:hypothetical protein MHU86_13673 [Fragilaria crotonensis]